MKKFASVIVVLIALVLSVLCLTLFAQTRFPLESIAGFILGTTFIFLWGARLMTNRQLLLTAVITGVLAAIAHKLLISVAFTGSVKDLTSFTAANTRALVYLIVLAVIGYGMIAIVARLFVSIGLVKSAAVAIVGAAAIVGGWFWWHYGPGLSEETSYRLAVEHARLQGFDLAQYNEPVRNPIPSRLYEYTWTPKDGQGQTLTIVVDSQIVEVYAEEHPTPKKTP